MSTFSPSKLSASKAKPKEETLWALKAPVGPFVVLSFFKFFTQAAKLTTNPSFPSPVVPRSTALDVPGKIILDPETLASQQKGLEKIAQQLRRERLDKEAVDAITFGFCPRAELWNGRCDTVGSRVYPQVVATPCPSWP